MPFSTQPNLANVLDSCRCGRLADFIAWKNTGVWSFRSDSDIVACALTAVEYGHLAVLSWLLESSGYLIDFGSQLGSDRIDSSLIYHAVQYNRLDIVKWLAIDFAPIASNLHEENSLYFPAIAVMHGHLEILKWYMANLVTTLGLDLEEECEQVLIHALTDGQREILEWLVLDFRRGIDLNAVLDGGYHPIGLAAESGQLDLVRWMILDYGQAVNSILVDNSVIDSARKAGHTTVADFLETVTNIQKHIGLGAVSETMKEFEAHKMKITRRTGGEGGF